MKTYEHYNERDLPNSQRGQWSIVPWVVAFHMAYMFLGLKPYYQAIMEEEKINFFGILCKWVL